MANYYEILGLSHDASPESLREAYLRLAKSHHPDLHPGDPKAVERFQVLQEAFRALANPEIREAYDEFLHGFEDEGHRGPAESEHRAFLESQIRELVVPVRWDEACLGCAKEIEIDQTEAGIENGILQASILIPEASRDGQELQFSEAGLAERLGLRLRLKVLVPQQLNRRQRRLLGDFEREALPDAYPRRSAFQAWISHV